MFKGILLGFFLSLFAWELPLVGQSSMGLEEGVQIRGQVVGFSGEVWPNAAIELDSLELPSSNSKTIHQSAKADSQGRYSFASLPEGSYQLTVFGGPGTIRETKKTPLLLPGNIHEVDFGIEIGLVFCKPKQVYGKTLDSRGRAIEGSVVVFMNAFKQGYQLTTKSGKDGGYSVEVCVGGQYVLYASKPGYETQVMSVVIPRDTSLAFSKQKDFRLNTLSKAPS